MVNITHLRLHRLTTNFAVDPRSRSILNLPKLENLFITSSPNRVWGFLSHSRLPSLTDLRVEEINDTSDPTDYDEAQDAAFRFISSSSRELRSFNADRVEFTRFTIIIMGLKPKIVAFSSVLETGPLEVRVQWLVQSILQTDTAFSRVEALSIYDGSRYSTFLSSLIAFLEYQWASGNSPSVDTPQSDDSHSSSQVPKRIDLHSGGPIPGELSHALEALSTNAQSAGITITAHHSPHRAGRFCTLPEDDWESAAHLNILQL